MPVDGIARGLASPSKGASGGGKSIWTPEIVSVRSTFGEWNPGDWSGVVSTIPQVDSLIIAAFSVANQDSRWETWPTQFGAFRFVPVNTSGYGTYNAIAVFVGYVPPSYAGHTLTNAFDWYHEGSYYRAWRMVECEVADVRRIVAHATNDHAYGSSVSNGGGAYGRDDVLSTIAILANNLDDGGSGPAAPTAGGSNLTLMNGGTAGTISLGVGNVDDAEAWSGSSAAGRSDRWTGTSTTLI